MFFNKNKAENKICDDAFALTVKGDYEVAKNLLKDISDNFGRAALLEGLILAVMGKNKETYNYDEIKRLLTFHQIRDIHLLTAYVQSTFSLSKAKLKQFCPILKRK